jgi:hypothetical protein
MLCGQFKKRFAPLNETKIGTYTKQTKWNNIAFLCIVPYLQQGLAYGTVNIKCATANASKQKDLDVCSNNFSFHGSIFFKLKPNDRYL